ncbi:MAG: efflux RND transporter permease subunit [Myxococcales bacterium]|nr:efflux RND transporter permease subunit [Myxococcales bacterium]
MVITRYAIRFRTAVFVLIFNLLIVGLISFQAMPREMTPDIEIPVVVVQVPYPGASPGDVEKLILSPLEKELKDLKDVNKMSGAAYEGAAVVTIEFSPEANIDESLQSVRDRVSRVRPKLPADIKDPSTQEVSFSDFPVLIVNISGNYSPERLKRFATDLQEDIEGVPGVLQARLSGGLEEQFRISIDPEAAAARKVGLGAVVSAIQAENINLPGGLIEVDRTSYLLRTPADFRGEKQLREVVVKAPGRRVVKLTDVARIDRAFVKPTSYARIRGRNCVSLQITKRTGSNIISVVDGVKDLVTKYEVTAPTGTEIKLLGDQSVEIRRMVDDLVNNIITGLVLVIAVIFFFMGARNAALVSLAVPLSMLLTFVTLDMMGVTLNMVTLFSLILALGMLVDNAIVIIENIYRHLGETINPETDGAAFRKARLVAAFTGTKEVAWPVIASTATTVAAFGPLLFWPGIMGKFMGYLPLVVIITLVSSLIVGLIINPVTAAVFMARPSAEGAPEATDDNWEEAFTGPLARLYAGTLRHAIDHKGQKAYKPLLVIVIAVASLIGSGMLYGASGLGVEFFPTTTPKRATISVTAANGTSLDGSDRIVRQIEAVLLTNGNIKSFVATPGAAVTQFGPGGGGSANTHNSGVSVDFVDEDKRIESSLLTIDKLRTEFAKIAGARIEVMPEKMGPPAGSPINVRVKGSDYAVLGAVSGKIMEVLRQMQDDGVADPKSNYVTGRPEMQVVVDREAAKVLGANTRGVAMAIRNAFNGNESSVIRDGTDEYDIVVRYAEKRRGSPADLSSIRVPGKDGVMIPLDQLIKLVRTSGSGTIRHHDTDRVVTLEAEVAPGANANKLRAELAKRLKDDVKFPAGYSWTFGGENAEQAKTAAFLGRALMTGVFLILLILVTQFNSLLKPVIIISSVVLSLIGVFAGLIITQMPFGVVMTGLGVISLAGVVVNNAIVLIDYIEQLQRTGLQLHEAVLRAGLTRLRPVLLTALTTVLGLVPMAMGWSVDFLALKFESAGSSGEFWGGMAIAVIFGLLFATLLTLVVVPALYVVLEQIGAAVRRKLFGSTETLDLEVELGARAGASTAVLGALLVGAVLTFAPTPTLAQASQATLALKEPKGAVKAYNLDALLSQMKTSGPDLLAAQSRMRQAVLIVDRAWSALHPQITASGQYSLNDPVIELQFADPEAMRKQAQAQVSGHIGNLQVVKAQMAANGQNTAVVDSAIAAQTKYRDEMPLVDIDPVQVNKRHGLNAAIQLRMSLYDARTFDGLKMARSTARIARKELKLTGRTLAHAVARAYAGAVLQRESLGVLERRLAAAKRALDTINKQMAAGVGTPLGRSMAALRVIQGQRAVAGALLAYHSAVASLGLMIGIDERFDVAGDVTAERPTGNEAKLLHLARTQREELVLLGEQTKLMNLRVGETRKRWLPRFSLVGQSQWSNAAGFGGQNVTSVLMVQVSQQLWDGGNSSIDRKEALGHLEQVQLRRQVQRHRVAAEVRGTMHRIATLQKDLLASQKALEVSEKAVKDATAGLAAGSNTELELKDLEDRVVEGKLAVLQARVQHTVAVLDLRQAVGLGPR